MHALLEAKNLSCGYQGQVIFDGLNFTLNQGQFAGLVGPSGSGKTTFLKSLLGLVDPWQGNVYFKGRKAGKQRARIGPRIGYVPQVETVDWNFPVTAAEVVMMGRYRRQQLWPWPSKQDRDIAHHLLSRVGAAHVAHRAIGELSGGQQQRVFLARALVGNPDLVLLDEPTSSADVQTQHELLHLLWDLNDQGVSIFLSTHDLNSVATHLPWVVCFNHGIIAQGPPLEVLTSENLRDTFGGDMVVQTQGDRVLIANRATAIRHPVQRPRPAILSTDAVAPSNNLGPNNLAVNIVEHGDIDAAHVLSEHCLSKEPDSNKRDIKRRDLKKTITKGPALNNVHETLHLDHVHDRLGE